MCPPDIDLGAWMPDQPSVSNGGLRDVYNAIPAERGYDALPSLSPVGIGALNSTCLGAATGRARNGTNFTVAGTATKLYLATTGSLVDESSGAYTLTGENWWSHVLFGNRVIASSYADPMESFVIGSSSAFAALSSHSPQAKHLAVVKDFVVAGNIIGRGDNASPIGTAEDGVQWCALDDPTSWPEVGTAAAKAVQSDWQPLAGAGGQVTDIVGGSDYGLVFQERAIWRMDYEGGDTFFRFTPIDENRGCWIHKAAIRVGGITYFPAEDGFMATDGLQTVPIGNERVDKWFIGRFDANTQHRLSVAYFTEWKCVGWLFMGTGATASPNTLLLFNVQSSLWSYANVTAEWLVDVLPFAISLDDDSSSLDAGTYSAVSLDSLVGAARRTLGAFDTSHGLSTFTGTPFTAYFETNEFEPAPGRVGTVKSIRPVCDHVGDSQIYAGVKTRMRVSDSQVSGPVVVQDATGKCSQRASGRYLSAYFIGYGAFKNFRAFDADVIVRGVR